MSEQSESEAHTWAMVARITADPPTGPCRRIDLARGSDEGSVDGVQYLITVHQQATPVADDADSSPGKAGTSPLLDDDSLVVPVVPTRWDGMVVRMNDVDDPVLWLELGDLGPGTVEDAMSAAKLRTLAEINRSRP